MNVTLPNGAVIQGVPEGTTKEQIMQKAIASGLASQEDFDMPEQPQEPQFVASTVDELKTKKYPNVFSAPELGGTIKGMFEGDMSAHFKAGLGGLLTRKPEEIMGIIAKQYPDKVESGEFTFGKVGEELMLQTPSGVYALNPKGIDSSDVLGFISDVAQFTPAGRVMGIGTGQLAKGAIVASATEGLQQGVEAGLGGEANASDVLLAGGVQAGSQVVSPLITQGIAKAKEVISPSINRVMTKYFNRNPKSAEQKLGEALKGGDQAKVIQEVMADPNVIKAADELGMTVNPSVYSTNEMYKEFEKSLRALPESTLNAQERENIKFLAKSADDLVTEYSGMIDKSQISAEFSDKMMTTIKSMADEADVLYKTIDEHIPKTLIVKPRSAISYLDKHIEEMGGFDNVSPKIKALYNQLASGNGVTYAFLDQTRKDLGSALKNQGPFKDDSQNIIKGLYGVLADDTLQVAKFIDAFSGQEGQTLTELAVSAKELVKKRKGLEESMTSVLGNNLSKTLMQEISAGIRSIQGTAGNPQKFRDAMALVPSEDKTMVAVSALNDILTGGRTKASDFSLGGFVSSYEALMRSKNASNELMQYIPTEAKKRLENMYLVSKGIQDANKKDLSNPSGTAAQVVAALNNPSGMFSKLYNTGSKIGAGAAMTAPIDSGTTGAVIGFVSSMLGGKTKTTDAAQEMLKSPVFSKAISEYIKGNVEEAEKMLANSSAAKNWIKTMNTDIRRSILRQGVIQYLTNSEEE